MLDEAPGRARQAAWPLVQYCGMGDRIIYLRREAPAKPALGAPCNGCGACCAASTCPAARVLLLQWRGPCGALEWHADQAQYRCGLLADPGRYLPALPRVLLPWMARVVRRHIAAGIGCDSATTATPLHT